MLGGVFEGLASTLGQLDKGAEGSQQFSKTAISFCLLGDSDTVQPVPYEETCSVALGCIFLTKLSETDNGTDLSSRRPFVGLIFTHRHHAAQWAIAREHQNQQVRHLRHGLFKDES